MENETAKQQNFSYKVLEMVGHYVTLSEATLLVLQKAILKKKRAEISSQSDLGG